jgi:hypothetical protein
MGLFSFNTQSPKKFEYRPRYFNPDKEAFDARMKRLQQEVDAEKDGSEPPFTFSIRDAYDRKRKKKVSEKKTSAGKMRFFVIILSIILVIVFFYLLAILTSYILKYA